MMCDLAKDVLEALKRDELLHAGDRVGVAVSGGADSVALLLLLLELREKLGVVLSVVHFNHKLRGKASDADEKFVAKLAAKHGLDFHSTSVRVAKLAKRVGGLSIRDSRFPQPSSARFYVLVPSPGARDSPCSTIIHVLPVGSQTEATTSEKTDPRSCREVC
jgi:3'-phosphoadenosine 5'-phosphosulfate sulfotransferase (PAPS reductase)/FAD synthetase